MVMIVLTDDPEPFRLWLQAQPPDEAVFRGDTLCPLAKFTGSLMGFYRSYNPNNLADNYPLPEWASKFAWSISLYGTTYGRALVLLDAAVIAAKPRDHDPPRHQPSPV